MKKITLFAFLMVSVLGFAQDPTTAAPTPPARNASDVISFFSNAYANVPIDTWSAVWDDSSFEDIMVAGNDTKKITFVNFLGVDFSSVGKHINASAMTHFHMDFWTNNPNVDGKVLNTKLIQFAGTDHEVSNLLLHVEHTANGTIPAIVSGSWVSIDVEIKIPPFDAGSTSLIRDDIAQIVMTSNLGIVYIDNLYLYKESLGTQNFKKASINMYPNPVKNTLNIEAKSNIKKVSVYNVLGQEVLAKNPNSNATTLQTNNLAKGVYVVKAIVDGKEATSKFVKE